MDFVETFGDSLRLPLCVVEPHFRSPADWENMGIPVLHKPHRIVTNRSVQSRTIMSVVCPKVVEPILEPFLKRNMTIVPRVNAEITRAQSPTN